LIFLLTIGIYYLIISPGYLTDNRGAKKPNRFRHCGLSVYHFSNIKDGLVAANWT